VVKQLGLQQGQWLVDWQLSEVGEHLVRLLAVNMPEEGQYHAVVDV
jgi:hypothetical protein